MTSFWISCSGASLEQGDYLPNCLMPAINPELSSDVSDNEIFVDTQDLIVLTQSCDLANQKSTLVALCPIYRLPHWEETNPAFTKKGAWESVRKGRQEGLHMLGSTEDPEENRTAFVVDFREIVSLPIGYLTSHAEQLGIRWRLQSPFREHFSQSFARFFMRVGLPAAIPPFR